MPLTAMGKNVEKSQETGMSWRGGWCESMAITKHKQRPTQLTSSGVAVYLRPPTSRRVANLKH